MVVLHEYGHAIQDNSNIGFSDTIPSGVSEGFGDFLPAVYYDPYHKSPSGTRGFMMSWDSEMGTGSWPGRRYDMKWQFGDANYNASLIDPHLVGQFWCASMFELFRKLGGDSTNATRKARAIALTIRLHLVANFNVPTTGSTATDFAQQMEAADNALAGWSGYPSQVHKKVIYDTARLRLFPSFPNLDVDVYIDDGRAGGYGSMSGNDLFSEDLWKEVWWDCDEIWTKLAPYPNPTAQQAGTPADFQEPVVGSPAYLYVRVFNKGTNGAGSGLINVRAFHCAPGMGLDWPTAWTPMAQNPIPWPNVLPVSGNGVVVGPFIWTPKEVGHECVLAYVENDFDHAIPQDLAPTDIAHDGDMVPFDNNTKQRNLQPVPGKGISSRGFNLTNTTSVLITVRLVVVTTLPTGWQWSLTGISDPNNIPINPNDTVPVTLSIDQASGQEITDFPTPYAYQVQITAVTDENGPMGGMTFYLAPDSVFPPG